MNECIACGENLIMATESSHIKCTRCGFEGQSTKGRILSPHLASVHLNYPEDGYVKTAEIEDRSFWFQHRSRIIQTLIHSYPASGHLLDVGGGNGFQALVLQNSGIPVTVVEPGIEGCLNADRRGVKRIINGTLQSLKLNDNCVGGAMFFDVLEHLDDPEKILNEAHRILKPGGKIYITVPAHSFLWSAEDEYAQHCRRYNRKELVESLKISKFKVDFISYYFGALLLPILVFRTIPYLFQRKRERVMNPRNHHPGGLAQKLVESLLTREENRFRLGEKIRVGTSLLCVASK